MSRMLFMLLTMVALALGIVCRPSFVVAQGDEYWEAFGRSTGFGLSSNSLTAAQFQDQLAVGGHFPWAGNNGTLTLVNRIALWDGSAWSALGGGVDDFNCPGPECDAVVIALIEYNGNLIVGGHFPSVDGGIPAPYIAQWDGQTWQSLGAGLNDQVWSLAVYEGELIVGGSFTMAGSVAVNHIASWDGATWKSLDANFSTSVSNIVEFQGELIVTAGIASGYVVKWDGQTWTPLGPEFSATPAFLEVNDDTLYIGRVGSLDGGFVDSVILWDGSSWTALGYLGFPVFDGTFYNGQLVVAGDFTDVGPRIARWTGSAWEGLGSGTDKAIRDLQVWNGGLYAVGNFLMAGGKESSFIARWDDTETPVQIANLRAERIADGVRLAWEVSRSAAAALDRIVVQRSLWIEGPYEGVALHLAPVEGEMTYLDVQPPESPDAGSQAWYRLQLHGLDGNVSVTSPVTYEAGVERYAQARIVSAKGTRHSIRIRYGLPRATHLRVNMFDARGRLLEELYSGPASAGTGTLLWRPSGSGPMSRGLYFVQLSAGAHTDTRKLVIAR